MVVYSSYTVIKRFRDNYFSVTQLKHKKPDGHKKIEINKGYIFPNKYLDCTLSPSLEETQKEKIRESLVRSRTRIFDIAMCNDWEYYTTFTIDPKKYDRYNLQAFYNDYSQYIQNLRKRGTADIKYLMIPEMHKDGAWHIHGLMSGLPKNHLVKFTLGDKPPRYIRDKILAGFTVYDWFSYKHKFGYNDIEPIRNLEACCKYIVKYITEDLGRAVTELHSKVYYCSRGLKRPEIIYMGDDTEHISLPDFSNVWIERKDFFTFAQALEYANIQYYDSFINAGLDENTIEKILSG